MTTKFQQRHYEIITQAIQDEKASYVNEGKERDINTLQSFAESLASIFARDNNMFDEYCFLRACRPGADVRARTK